MGSVIPTRVGVNRFITHFCYAVTCDPHACGGEPTYQDIINTMER